MEWKNKDRKNLVFPYTVNIGSKKVERLKTLLFG